MFKLTIEDDEGKTTVIPLIRDEMTIGRQEGNTIRLTERNVSRKHARLLRQNGAVYVEDLASYTGVRVNGARIVTATPVAEGDQVQIGDYKLMVKMDRPAAAINPDRQTMPAMPAAGGPMNSPGGSVAIPTRATAAAMAAQAQVSQGVAPGPLPPPIPMQTAAMPAPQIGIGAPPPVAPRASAPAQRAVSAAPSGVPEALDAQPTIPVRALDPPVGSEAAASARFVILTSELAGQEFPLVRASLVIGRTDENDIVINHRSISRHHAKIVREGDRYTIVDLQSANGVRVNREDYERIDLKPGDIVELGHVKLRFVGPLETYVFDPNVRHERGPFSVKLALGLGALVVAGVGVFALRGARTADVTPSGLASTSTAPPAPAVAPPTPQAVLAEASRAATSEDWAGARAALEKLGPSAGGAPLERETLDLRRRVETESQAAVLYAQFSEAASKKSYPAALALYAEIPADSIYKVRGRARADESRSLLVAERVADAARARAEGRCDDVRAAVEEVGQLDPKNQQTKDMVRLCRPRPEPVAAKPARARLAGAAPPLAPRAAPAPRAAASHPDRQAEPKAERQSEPKPEKGEGAAPESDAPDPDALMKQAREAWLKQQCGSAIDLSRRALKAKPGLTDAYQIIAVCSCSLKDAESATRAYAKLDEKSRNLVHALCQKNGIIVGSE